VNAFSENLDFALTDCLGERRRLPINIADADFVEVDQGKCADAAARKCLSGPGADPAKADHANVRGVQALETVDSGQASNSAEAVLVITGCGHRRTVAQEGR